MTTSWHLLTPEQKREAVREAVEQGGLSYSQAASVLGCSRTAIAGVVERSTRTANPIRPSNPQGTTVAKQQKAARKRAALQIVQEKARRARAAANTQKPKPPSFGTIAGVLPAAPMEERRAYDYAWVALPGASPVALERHKDGCRWPIEAPGEVDRFCNEPTDGGRYCAVHHAMGTRPEVPPAKRTVAGKVKAFNL